MSRLGEFTCAQVSRTTVVPVAAMLCLAFCAAPGPEAVEPKGDAWFEVPEGTPAHDHRLLSVDERDGWLELVPDLVIEERRGTDDYSFGESAPTIALDDAGRFFVYDPSNYRVAVFSSVGEFLYQFGSRGEGPGEFSGAIRRPIGFLDDRLFIYIGYRRLGFWTPEGEYINGSEHRVTGTRVVPLYDGTVISSAMLRDASINQVAYTVARFAVTDNGLQETQRYARIPAGLQPNFAAEHTGEVYLSTIGPATQVVAFDPDGSVRWVSRFHGSLDQFVMPADLLLDGQGRIYVLPRLNRVKELPPPVIRTVDVLSPDGKLLAAVKIPDLPITIMWQQTRDQFVYGVQADPDTYEWQVVRYTLNLPFE